MIYHIADYHILVICVDPEREIKMAVNMETGTAVKVYGSDGDAVLKLLLLHGTSEAIQIAEE